MNHPNVTNLPGEARSEISRALDDAEKIYNKSASFSSYQRSIKTRRDKIQKQPGYDMKNQGYYEQTMNTLLQAKEDYYGPKSATGKAIGVKSTRTGKVRSLSIPLQKLRIQMDMVNAGIDPEANDVDSLLDSSLTLRENRANVAKQLGYSYSIRQKKEAKEQAAHHQCISAQERCEIHGDSEACKQYVASGCHKIYGPVEM